MTRSPSHRRAVPRTSGCHWLTPGASNPSLATALLAGAESMWEHDEGAGRPAGAALGDDPAAAVADLASALGLPLDVPPTAAAQALHVVADLAVGDERAGPLLLAATGRIGLPAGFSVP